MEKSVMNGIWGVLLAFSSSLIHAEEAITLAVHPEVASVIEGLEGAPIGKRSVAWASTSTVMGPYGGTMESKFALQYLGQHKWGGQAQILLNGKSTQMTMMSLCGLVNLVSGTSPYKFSAEVPVTVPVGPIFLSWGVKTENVLESSTKVKKLTLTSDAGHICKPVAGSRFAYEVTSEMAFDFKGHFISRRNGKEFFSAWACEVGMSSQTEGPPLRAEYLPVKCKRTVAETQKEIVVQYAYLPEFGFYLELANGDGAFAGKYNEIKFDSYP